MMRYVPNDKYTIAWFKLAECVAKGEKEKAFGVYRLLMHSLEDQAYAYQLEGDLLGAFGDERAVEKYAHAAQLYHHDQRYKEAAALYYDLVFQVPEDDRYVLRLIDIYKKYKNPDIVSAKLRKLADTFLEKELYWRAVPLVSELQEMADVEMVAQLHIHIVIGMIKNQPDWEDKIAIALQNALDFLSQASQKKQLQLLLATLEQTNSAWHKRATEHLAVHGE